MLRKGIPLFVMSILILSLFELSVGLAILNFQSIDAQTNLYQNSPFSISGVESNNSDQRTPPGYYKVIDVYPTGERVFRGIAPFGKAVSYNVQAETNRPTSREYLQLDGRQGLFTYFGKIETDQGTVPRVFLIEPKNNTSEIEVKNHWDIELGTAGYRAVIDCGLDGVDDFIVPNKDNVPILINGSTGAEIHKFDFLKQNEVIYGVVSGNFDDDIGLELAFVYGDAANKVLFLKILDDYQQNFTEIKTIDLYNTYLSKYSGSLESRLITIKAADLDNDGYDELIFGAAVKYYNSARNEYWLKPVLVFIDDFKDNFAEIQNNIQDNVYDIPDGASRNLNFVSGDFDGDGTTEILFVLFHGYIFVYNSTNSSIDFVDDFSNKHITDSNLAAFSNVKLIARDMNVDGRDEVVLFESDYSGGTYSYKILLFQLNKTDVVSYKKIVSGTIGTNTEPYSDIAVGNFDNDTFYEIALLINNRVHKYLTFYGDVTQGYKETVYKSWTVYGAPTYPKPILIPFSLEGKILLKYTGYHNQSKSQPYVIAVMAAPPTIKGITQNYGGSGTLFGTAVSRTTSETTGYTISTGVTLSFEAEDIFKIVNVHASTTISRELTKTHTVEQTIQECRDFQGDYTYDYVIFETVTYDNYYYEVIAHPIKSYIGQKIAISIPNKPVVYKWTVDYFNSHNGNNPDIGNETFNHTVGEVWTYPTADDVSKLEAMYKNKGFWKTDGTMTVGEGLGVNSIELDLEKVETTETSTTYGVEFEAGFSIFGVGMSVSYGLSSTYVYSVSVGKTTKYQGVIGDIAARDYEKYSYSVGLFVYNLYREKDHMAYQVLNYWVEDYHGPTEINSPVADIIFYNPTVADTVVKISAATGVDVTTAFIGLSVGSIILIGIASLLVFKIIRRHRGTRKSYKKKKSHKKK